MLKEFSLEGRTAIVTGAGRGIGRAIASTLAEAGADIVAASRTLAQLNETAAEVHKQGRKCLPVPTDITNADHLKKLVDTALSNFGMIDILVNNAGMGSMKMTIPVPALKKCVLPRYSPI